MTDFHAQITSTPVVKSIRTQFESWFPASTDNCLRQLSSAIASFYHPAFGTISPAPFNLLSNAATSGWCLPPPTPTPADLVGWKLGQNGFPAYPLKGLGLLFDPFVDALLWAHGGSIPPATTVLVLTDYSDIGGVIGEIMRYSPNDWAEVELSAFFKPKSMGRSGDNLRKLIIGKDFSLENPEAEELMGNLPLKIQQHRLLLWNYFPFLRGIGVGCTGGWARMLPKNPTHRAAIFSACDDFLHEFLRCVNAKKVVIAVAGDLWSARPTGTTSTFRSPLVRINHPYVWGQQDIRLGHCAATLAQNIARVHSGSTPDGAELCF